MRKAKADAAGKARVDRQRCTGCGACVNICPVGARKFGNLLDPAGEMQYLLREKRVFIFKEELATKPKFYYFYAT